MQHVFVYKRFCKTEKTDGHRTIIVNRNFERLFRHHGTARHGLFYTHEQSALDDYHT